MSSFWSIWIIVITLGSIGGCWWLLQSNRSSEWDGEGDAPTTGHAYDGIEEFDNPLPHWWFMMFLGTMIFGLVYLALYPGLGNFKGLLGWSQEQQWSEEVAKAEEEYGPVFAAYAAKTVDELLQDTKALRSGQRIFANYCAVCHGSAGAGSYGFPNLTDDDWLYGGDADTIKATLVNGRKGIMPPWQAALGDKGITETAEYVMGLSGRDVNEELAAAGAKHYQTFCAACHGPEGKGVQALGAPNLTDEIWLYGGSPELIKHSLRYGRNGNMPAFIDLLGDDKIHVVSAYVKSLSQ